MWRYEVYADSAGRYRSRLKASNGKRVATSGESFYSHADAQGAADNVHNNAGGTAGPLSDGGLGSSATVGPARPGVPRGF